MDCHQIQSAIERNLPFLCEQSKHVRKLLKFLFANGFLIQEEVEDISNRTSNVHRFSELYHLMMQRLGNQEKCELFQKALYKSGNDKIVKILQSKDEISTNLEEHNTLKRKAPSFKDTPLQDGGFKRILFNIQDPIHSFTGRNQFLKDLHKNIHKSKDIGEMTVLSQTLVLNGLGGIGKTQTVRKYIQQYTQCYDHIIFIDAENHASAHNQFKTLAREYFDIFLGDYDKNPTEFNVTIQQLYEKICENSCSLLIIFDNAEALDDRIEEGLKIDGIRRYIPKSLHSLDAVDNPSILVTTRNLDWQISRVLQLGLWSPQEAIEFVMKVLVLADNDENRDDALKLAKLFGFYPLPLQTATTVIIEQAKRLKCRNNSSYGIGNLIVDYESGKRDVLSDARLERLDDFKMNMMTLWRVMMSNIEKYEHGEIAQKIMKTSAYLSDSKISKTILLAAFENEDTYDDGLELLIDYALLEDCGEHFGVHRVIQDVNIAHYKLKLPGSRDSTALELMPVIKCIVNNTQESQARGKIDSYVMQNTHYILDYVSDNLEHSEYFEFTDFYAKHFAVMFHLNYYEKLYNFATKNRPDYSKLEEYAKHLELKAAAFQVGNNALQSVSDLFKANFMEVNVEDVKVCIMQMANIFDKYFTSPKVSLDFCVDHFLELFRVMNSELQKIEKLKGLKPILDILENHQIKFNATLEPGTLCNVNATSKSSTFYIFINAVQAVFGPDPLNNKPGLMLNILKLMIDELDFFLTTIEIAIESQNGVQKDNSIITFLQGVLAPSHLNTVRNFCQYIYEWAVLLEIKPEEQVNDLDIYALHQYAKLLAENIGVSYTFRRDFYKNNLKTLEPLLGLQHQYVVKCRSVMNFISELTESEPSNLTNMNDAFEALLKSED